MQIKRRLGKTISGKYQMELMVNIYLYQKEIYRCAKNLAKRCAVNCKSPHTTYLLYWVVVPLTCCWFSWLSTVLRRHCHATLFSSGNIARLFLRNRMHPEILTMAFDLNDLIILKPCLATLVHSAIQLELASGRVTLWFPFRQQND